MEPTGKQAELFGFVWWTSQPKFRLRVNDVVRIDGKLGQIVRVNECAAVVLINRRVREFTTRFDKHVRFQPSPITFRISPNSEIEILSRNGRKRQRKRKPR